jgi:plastocyanin
MNMKKQIRIKGTLATITLLFFLSCGKKDSAATPYPGSTGVVNSNTVSIYNMSFAAKNIAVTKGTTVTWTNDDDMQHTVTADDNSFTSPTLKIGDTYTHTFDNIGTIAYHCSIHSGMKGSVAVK